jgi:hypothetical protein
MVFVVKGLSFFFGKCVMYVKQLTYEVKTYFK